MPQHMRDFGKKKSPECTPHQTWHMTDYHLAQPVQAGLCTAKHKVMTRRWTQNQEPIRTPRPSDYFSMSAYARDTENHEFMMTRSSMHIDKQHRHGPHQSIQSISRRCRPSTPRPLSTRTRAAPHPQSRVCAHRSHLAVSLASDNHLPPSVNLPVHSFMYVEKCMYVFYVLGGNIRTQTVCTSCAYVY